MGKMASEKKRRFGCIILGSFLFALWLTIAWLLWHWSLRLPMPTEDEKSEPWEIMPKAEGT